MKDEERLKPIDFISAEVRSLSKLLKLMGLGKREVDIYLYLLSKGPSTAKDIARDLNLPYSKSYEALTKLTRLGWVIKSEERPYRFYPMNIREVWNEMKKNIESKMLEVEEKLIPIVEKVATNSSPLFRILLIDEDEVQKFLSRMLQGRGREISLAIAHRELLNEEIVETLSAFWEGRARVILTKELAEDAHKIMSKKNIKFRVIKEMFGSGAIGHGILLIYKNEDRLNGLWSDHAYFVDLGKVYFEYLWSQANEVQA